MGAYQTARVANRYLHDSILWYNPPMKIKSIQIENFRAIRDQVIDLDNYTTLVGGNGSGKSTVLNALNLFFRNSDTSPLGTTKLSKTDYYNGDTNNPIRVTITFTELSDDAKDSLQAYVRHGQLVVSCVAVWDQDSESASLRQFGQRLVMTEFSNYFLRDSEGAKAAELKEIYANLQSSFPDLAKSTSKAAMESSLREYEEAHPELCKLQESSDQFYGFSKGINKLEPHIQWIFVPAVRDASEEDNAAASKALKILVERTASEAFDFDTGLSNIQRSALEEYRKFIESGQEALDELTSRLKAGIQIWAHPEAGLRVIWDQSSDKAVSITKPVATIRAIEHAFEGELGRFGHGLQRSYLMALLQELASTPGTGGPTLILGVEEPELYQHPPQVRHFSEVLEKLSLTGSQILICTHSPLFVKGDRFSDVRAFSKCDKTGEALCSRIDQDKLATRLGNALNKPKLPATDLRTRMQKCLQPEIAEILFAPKIVLVEGIEDFAILKAWTELSGRSEDFRAKGIHIIPCGNKSQMIEPLAILRELNKPTFAVFDQDGDCDEKHRHHHKRDNQALFTLCDKADTDFIDATSIDNNHCAWKTCIQDAISDELGDKVWADTLQQTRDEHDLNVSGTKKSPLLIGLALAKLHSEGVRIKCVDQLLEKILMC